MLRPTTPTSGFAQRAAVTVARRNLNCTALFVVYEMNRCFVARSHGRRLERSSEVAPGWRALLQRQHMVASQKTPSEQARLPSTWDSESPRVSIAQGTSTEPAAEKRIHAEPPSPPTARYECGQVSFAAAVSCQTCLDRTRTEWSNVHSNANMWSVALAPQDKPSRH